MRTRIIIGALLIANSAQAYNYGETIERNETVIKHNAYYAKAEEVYADRLSDAKRQLARDIERYRNAHIAVEKSEARVRALEDQRPSHKRYRSDWDYGGTSVSWR